MEEGEKNLDKRLECEGFKRAPGQLRTKRDGNCGITSILHILETVPDYQSIGFYKAEDHLTFRKMVCLHFQRLIQRGELVYAEGQVIEWFKKMTEDGCFVDHYWFTACAKMLGRDIVFLPTFTKNSTELNKFIRVRSDQPEVFPPIFLGYMEKMKFIHQVTFRP